MPVILKLEDRAGEMFRLLKQSTLLFILQAIKSCSVLKTNLIIHEKFGERLKTIYIKAEDLNKQKW